MALYRNNDQEFERLLSRPSAERKIALRLSFQPTADGFGLTGEVVGAEGNGLGGVTVSLPFEHQPAQKPQRDNIVRQLSKLGGTIYECSRVDVADGFSYFVPSSLLAELRRMLVAALAERTVPSAGARSAGAPSAGRAATRAVSAAPAYDHDYLYNIANRLACDFYGSDRPTAFELRGGKGPLMQCRHCLRYALGYCVKHGGRKPEWRDPLRLRLGDGRLFRLEFDCKNCQMNVYGED
jgi:putative protease